MCARLHLTGTESTLALDQTVRLVKIHRQKIYRCCGGHRCTDEGVGGTIPRPGGGPQCGPDTRGRYSSPGGPGQGFLDSWGVGDRTMSRQKRGAEDAPEVTPDLTRSSSSDGLDPGWQLGSNPPSGKGEGGTLALSEKSWARCRSPRTAIRTVGGSAAPTGVTVGPIPWVTRSVFWLQSAALHPRHQLRNGWDYYC